MPDVPRSEEFDDVYFNSEDGPGETAYVFFDGNNLPQAWQGAERFVIGETGFGTGLNFLLTWALFDKTAPKGAMLDFVSVEKFPLSAEQIRDGLAQFSDILAPYLDKFLEKYPLRVPGFHRLVFDNRVALTLIFDDAGDALSEVEGDFDAWFLDGFTPSRNPDMWTEKVFAEIARLSHKGTTLSTFTSAGFVKRGLRAVGFDMQKRKGFGFKWSMLTGVFENAPEKKSPARQNDIVIKGAGLSGCAAAYVLPQYGFDVRIYDTNGVASGASGNPVGILNPRLSAFRTAESDFYTAAYAMAAREFPHMEDVEYERCGSLHFLTDEEKDKKLLRAVENWGWYDAHMRLVASDEASRIAGVRVEYSALYLPDGGKINPAKLCATYVRSLTVTRDALEGGLSINAHGAGIPLDDAFLWLPVHTVRGQITQVRATTESEKLKVNLCYGGYMSPAFSGMHVVGSTFQKWLSHSDPVEADDNSNMARLNEAVPSLPAFEIIGHRAALRTSAKDRFPVIGAMPENGAYITTAHGSHGIIGSLLGAHILADYLRGGPFCVGKSTLNALSPARFLERAQRRAEGKI